MSPEVLLLILARARRHPSADPGKPFLLQSTEQGSQVLSHPMLSEAVVIDAETYYALQTLVRVGYLIQPDQGNDYKLTPDGLTYAARLDGTWDGIERRRQERRASGARPDGVDNRRADRRVGA